MTGEQVVQRPMRLRRAILWCVGVLLLLVGGVLTIRAARDPDLTKLDGWVAWIGAPLRATEDLPERIATLAAVGSVGVGACLIIVSAILTWFVRTRFVQVDGHDLSVDTRLLAMEQARTTITERQALVFWQSLREPALRFSRISESIEQGSRTVRVSTSVSIVTSDLGADLHAVPIALFTRGSMENGLRFSSGGRVSSLSHLQSVAYASAVVDRLVASAGSKAVRAYESRSPGCESLRIRVRRILMCTTAGGSPDAETVAQAIADLPFKRRQQNTLFAAATVVAYLTEQYPVCVHVRKEGTDGTARVTMERTALPAVVPFKRPDNPKGKQRVGLVKRLETGRKRLVDFLESMFGVPPHTLDYSTRMAQRTASYHLNIRGPEGFYLAHQELRDDADDGRTLTETRLKELQYSMNPRQGQRTGHLYARDGREFRNLIYSCGFFERMPGSMSTAFVGAATTTLVALALAWSVLFSDAELTGLLQILLAFPLALTATSSTRSGAPFWGGDLSARCATIATVVILTFSLLASTIGTSSPREAEVVYWAVLLVASAGNTLLCLVFWTSRAFTHHSFVGR